MTAEANDQFYSSLPAANSPSRRPWPVVGMVNILAALVLLTLYFAFPIVTSQWSNLGRLLFGGLMVIVSLLGIFQVWEWVNPAGSEALAPRWASLSRHRISVPREGITYLIIMIVMFMGALLGHSNMLMLVFAMMAGPFVVNGWVTFGALRGAVLKRTIPPRAMVGEQFGAEIEFHNNRSWIASWMMVAKDTILHPQEKLEASVLFTRIGPMKSQSAYYQLNLAKRGKYRFGPIRLSSQFPLGLIERALIVDIPGEVLIHPRIGRLSPRWKKAVDGAAELVMQPVSKAGHFDDEFHHLRDYRAGDNPRAIHWRSSAKRTSLVVREYQPNREHSLLLILDLWRPSNGNSQDDQLVETALSLGATIAREHVRDCRDSELRILVMGAKTEVWHGPASMAGLEEVLDRLALATAGHLPDVIAPVQQQLQDSSAATRGVLVSTRGGGTDRSAASRIGDLPRHSRMQRILVDERTVPDLLSFE